MHQFFLKDVLVSAGGLRAPVRAILIVFGLSALIHEYLFSIAIGRVQGYQTAFFLLQGFAVAATARVKARYHNAAAGTARRAPSGGRVVSDSGAPRGRGWGGGVRR